MGQQIMEMTDRSSMWRYFCERFEGSANEQTKAMVKRQLYAQLEAARCKQNGNVEGHLINMCRLHSRLKTAGMILDDAVFNAMLVLSLPSNEQFDRLRGLVDTGMDCVSTPDKVVAMAITFGKANKADNQLTWSFGSGRQSSNQSQHSNGHIGVLATNFRP
ncbi:hypothetical protein PI124_g14068 [Phytophthora idaei]|nr:hypothetical protein PI126_g13633 [Phytophthora idaei]KAG3241040.1 hypothetical protein PI124_g14068 [Phytophthora idaei]